MVDNRSLDNSGVICYQYADEDNMAKVLNDSYSIAKEKIAMYISDIHLQAACKNVSYDWFNNDFKYRYIADKNVDGIIHLRKSNASRWKKRREMIKFLQHFI